MEASREGCPSPEEAKQSQNSSPSMVFSHAQPLRMLALMRNREASLRPQEAKGSQNSSPSMVFSHAQQMRMLMLMRSREDCRSPVEGKCGQNSSPSMVFSHVERSGNQRNAAEPRARLNLMTVSKIRRLDAHLCETVVEFST